MQGMQDLVSNSYTEVLVPLRETLYTYLTCSITAFLDCSMQVWLPYKMQRSFILFTDGMKLPDLPLT